MADADGGCGCENADGKMRMKKNVPSKIMAKNIIKIIIKKL